MNCQKSPLRIAFRAPLPLVQCTEVPAGPCGAGQGGQTVGRRLSHRHGCPSCRFLHLGLAPHSVPRVKCGNGVPARLLCVCRQAATSASGARTEREAPPRPVACCRCFRNQACEQFPLVPRFVCVLAAEQVLFFLPNPDECSVPGAGLHSRRHSSHGEPL